MWLHLGASGSLWSWWTENFAQSSVRDGFYNPFCTNPVTIAVQGADPGTPGGHGCCLAAHRSGWTMRISYTTQRGIHFSWLMGFAVPNSVTSESFAMNSSVIAVLVSLSLCCFALLYLQYITGFMFRFVSLCPLCLCLCSLCTDVCACVRCVIFPAGSCLKQEIRFCFSGNVGWAWGPTQCVFEEVHKQ